MYKVFLVIALVLLGMSAVLGLAPRHKVLNFVNYEGAAPVVRINRYAAARLLLPIGVSLACAYIVAMRPEFAVPLLFPTIISILAAVVWIAAGVTRLEK